jgi:catechol 2,3-dioxygenase-like lactoylglutathione lyase family enzyme
MLHHVELYVSDLAASLEFWDWLLGELGYEPYQSWSEGRSYIHGEHYIVFVQAAQSYLRPPYHRKRVGLNHLAFHATSREQVDALTAECRARGYTVLYPERHPYAGGPGYYALYCEDPDRIKVEVVAPEET